MKDQADPLIFSEQLGAGFPHQARLCKMPKSFHQVLAGALECIDHYDAALCFTKDNFPSMPHWIGESQVPVVGADEPAFIGALLPEFAARIRFLHPKKVSPWH